MWYLYASRIERLHPMNCGFWSVRRRRDRRAGLQQEALVPFWWNRTKVVAARLWKMVQLFFQLEDVWLRSRPKSDMEEALLAQIAKSNKNIRDWRDLKARELATFYSRLHVEMPHIKVPSVVALWFRIRNPFAGAFTRRYVQRIWQRWYLHLWNPLKWVEVWLFEWVNGFRFVSQLLDDGNEPERTM
jgi:hypothetical protein